MMPASNRAVGTSVHLADVCKMPAGPVVIAVPLVDLGLNAQSVPFSPNVYICFTPATNLGTKKVVTLGDETGTLGGIITGLIKGMGSTAVGNLVVYVNFLPGENLLNPTTGNNYNAMLGAQLVPSAVNVTYTYRSKQDAAAEPQAGAGSADAVMPPLEVLRSIATGTLDRHLRDAGAEGSCVEARMLSAGVGYLKLRAFESGVDRKVFNELAGLQVQGMQALLMDVRDNPGGDARAALDVADDFLERNVVIAQVRDADGDCEQVYARRPQAYHWPLAIVTNGDTASAAELLAGVLQQHGRATLVGQRTAGKASGQRLIPKGRQRARYVTVEEYQLADGRGWHGGGLVPDVVVPIGADAVQLAWRQLAQSWGSAWHGCAEFALTERSNGTSTSLQADGGSEA